MSKLNRGMPLILVLFAALPVLAQEAADPMRPPSAASTLKQAAQPGVQHYHLSSILISPQRRSAIINGRHVSVGDRVDKANVVEIKGNQVIISVAGSTRTLSLLPLSIKRPVETSTR